MEERIIISKEEEKASPFFFPLRKKGISFALSSFVSIENFTAALGYELTLRRYW